MKYMFKDFEEYLEYAPFNKDLVNLQVLKIIWTMARLQLDDDNCEIPLCHKCGQQWNGDFCDHE